MKIKFQKFSFTLSMILVSCSGMVQNGNGDVYGIVTDFTTAEPLRAAGVSLFSNGALLLKTVTYDDGHFEFSEIKAATYNLLLEMDGYDDENIEVLVEKDRTARADMQMKKNNTRLNVLTGEPVVSGNNVVFHGEYSQKDNYYAYKASGYGFVYGITVNPTRANNEISAITAADNKFTAKAISLTQGTYYVRAYVKNSRGICFGDNKQFTILGFPAVVTLEPTGVGPNVATLNGKIEYKGDPAYTEKGFVYSQYFQNPTIDDASSSTTRIKVNGVNDNFSINVSGLTKDATYYVRAYAISALGTVYGESFSFVASNELSYVVLDAMGVQKTDLTISASWNSANDICTGSSVGGYRDWRLPTLAELSSIYQNRSTIGGFSSSSNYWTSTKNNSGCYQYIIFSSGAVNYYDSRYSSQPTTNSPNNAVRCVRTL